MSSHPERDQAVERMLQARRQRGAPPDAPATDLCPSSDDIAAWADGDLDAARTAALEAHLASCARCEAILAVFAKAAPLPTPAWTRWRVLLPFIAVAAAASVTLAVWSWRDRASTPTPISTAARVENAPSPVTVPPPPPVMSPAPEMKPAVPQPQAATPPAAKRSPRATAAAADAGAPAATSSALEAKAQAAPPPPPPPAPIFAPPTAAPPPQSAANSAARPQTAGRAGDYTVDQMLKIPTARDPWQVVNMAPGITLTGPTVGGSASGQQLTAAPLGAPAPLYWNFDSFSDSTAVVAEFQASSALARAAGAGGGGRGGGASVAARASEDRIAPKNPTRWRIVADGHVVRSTDGGTTWMRMSTEAPVSITAGVAPDPTTCWLAGRSGVVMLTTDNEHFVRVDLPDRLDIKTVTATSARAATVTTATNVAYTTADGGRTWTRRE